LLKEGGFDLPPEVDEAFVLTQYAVQTRYPGAWEPITSEEVDSALETSAQVLAWVETQIEESE
jgi:HEPN domain-containing protein